METSIQNSNKTELLPLILSAIGITLFLFFIDEGYYNFNWMKNIGNWIIFVPYVSLIFSSQLFFSKIVLRSYKGKGKAVISALSGPIALGVIFNILITVFS